jgi:AcrR family transcriptional regulator
MCQMTAAKPRLGIREWTDAGLRALEAEGYPAVRADRLASALGVSRGSFYWHFEDVGAFEAALIERWREMVLEALDPPAQPGDAPFDRFASIMRRSLLSTRRLEVQFRAWGAVNPGVRAALDRVDANREAYFVRLLSSAGTGTPRVHAIARIAYWTYLGRMQTQPIGEAAADEIVAALLTLLE